MPETGQKAARPIDRHGSLRVVQPVGRVHAGDHLESLGGEVREDDEASRLDDAEQLGQHRAARVQVVQDVDRHGASKVAVGNGQPGGVRPGEANPPAGLRVVRQKRRDLLVVRVEVDADDVQAAAGEGPRRDAHAGADVEGRAGELTRLVEDELRCAEPVVAGRGEPACQVPEVLPALAQFLERQRHAGFSISIDGASSGRRTRVCEPELRRQAARPPSAAINLDTSAPSGTAPSMWMVSLITVRGTPWTSYLFARCGNSVVSTMSAVTRSLAMANLCASTTARGQYGTSA